MFRLRLSPVFLSLLYALGAGASNLAEFKTVFEARRELILHRDARESQTVREMFANSLAPLEEAATSAGNLDRVLHIRSFRSELLQGGAPEPHPSLLEDPAFQRLHETWLRLQREQQQQRDEQLRDLHASFDQALEQLQRRLTREGEIEKALEVQNTRTRLREDPEHQALLARLEANRREASAGSPRGQPPGQPVLATLAPAIALHLSFDRVERMRGRTPDSSRFRNHGEVDGAEWVAQGRRGGAIRFGGRNARVVVGNDASLQITGNQTIALWIHPEAFGVRRNPLEKAYGGEGTLTLEVDGTLNYYHGTAGRNAPPYQGFRLERPIPLNEWTHLTVTRDFTEGKLVWYVNGEAVNEAATQFQEAAASRSPLVLGTGYAGPFQGMLDEVMIFSQALAPGQVRALYQAVGGE